MPTILMAGGQDFWYADRGDRQRIAAVYQNLIHAGYRVPYLYTGVFKQEDEDYLKRHYPELEIYYLTQKELSIAREKLSLAPQPKEPFLVRKLNKLNRSIRKRSSRLLGKIQRSNRWFARQIKKTEFYYSRIERSLESLYSEPHKHLFKKIYDKVRPEYILIQYIHHNYLLDAIVDSSDRPLTLIDTHDVMSVRTQAFHKHKKTHWAYITKKKERGVLDKFDVIIAIQDNDGESFKKMLPHKKVIVTAHVPSIQKHPHVNTEQIELLFVGTGGHANIHAITDFLNSVWPALYEKFNENIVLNIVGGVCDRLDKCQIKKGVDLLGYVESVSDSYRTASIIINPVKFGGGLKIKCVEALANCKPLVTTSVGAEGLANGVNQAFYVCDTAEQMTEKLTLLIENSQQREELAIKAHEYALTHFSSEVVFSELSATLVENKPIDLNNE